MNRPDDQLIEKTLAGIAEPEDARIVAKWFATKEGNAFLAASIDKDFEYIYPKYCKC